MRLVNKTDKMEIRLCELGDQERWNDFVNKSKESNCYHQIGWKKVIERSFGHKTFYLLAEDQQRNITGIFPLANLKSLLFGNFMVSLPYFNYGGICAENLEVSNHLLEEAVHLAKKYGVSHIELRETKKLENGLGIKMAKVSMQLGLPSNSEELWQSFSSKLRSQINRPRKEGFDARFGRFEELDFFYEVFSHNMRDLGTPVYSKAFFKNILQEFPDTTRICSIFLKNKPVAAGFIIGFKNQLEIPWASSLREYNHMSPNMFLYWTVLKFACDNGYNVFDFGRSTPGEGTYRFKEQWGAKPVPLYWHYWMRNEGPLPEINPKGPRFRLAVNIWKKLPVILTRLIGPSVVKNLP